MLKITAKVIADSISENGDRLTTLQLEYPRFIHAEFLTHRMFARNASSSRAIPVAKLIERVEHDPVVPSYWTENKKGMQGDKLQDQICSSNATEIWLNAAKDAVRTAKALAALGVHKQHANRVLEPFSYISTLVTATEWSNFFNLRINDAAQPEIKLLAETMRDAIEKSVPNFVKVGEWHTPYYPVAPSGATGYAHRLAAAARCARVSYLNHAGDTSHVEDDIALATQLLTNGHLSPFEHVATPLVAHYPDSCVPGLTHSDKKKDCWSGPFRGWGQLRHIIDACQSVTN